MNEVVTGIIHVHSNFSRDGFCSIADLREYARRAGWRFVGLTEHAEDLSSDDMESLRRQCEKHSDGLFIMIPGLEFRCSGDIHILGLGITDHIPHSDPVMVAVEIALRGGLAILAHPGRSNYQFPRELCHVLNGIEIWNGAYDGRFVPPLGNLRLLQGVRRCNPAVAGFGGADLHGLHRPPGVVLQLRVHGITRVDAQMVLQHLRSGRFVVRGRYTMFDAYPTPNWLTHASLWGFRKCYEVSRAIRDVALGET